MAFFALSGMWVGVFHLISAIDLGEREALATPVFVGMLVLPTFCLGFVTRKWLAIVIPPVAYLAAWAVGPAMVGFKGLPGDLGWLGLAIVHLAWCAAMASAFAVGRGVGRVAGVFQQ